ncbi:MAG: Xaa-Pro peptidase family protein [Pseudomonadota bacterium]
MTRVDRGFPVKEYRARLNAAQKMMASADLGALLLSTEPEIRYFSGFLTRFWESPTRPWYMLIPAQGNPIAVIPSIGGHLMAQTWIEDIRTWQSPDYSDDGVGLLSDTIRECMLEDGRIGVPSGPESCLRMPLANWDALRADMGTHRFTDDAGIVRSLRAVKSELEIAKIRRACAIAGSAFGDVHRLAALGDPLDRVFRRFQSACLEHGADWVGYLAGGAGPQGYSDVISPAAEVPLAFGDVLMLDTGVVWDGYYCDFDRNYAVGKPDKPSQSAYARLIEATDRAFETARPGATAAELFHAMNAVTSEKKSDGQPGRLGHGLGMQLTEGVSLIPDDHTVLEAGMVLTLEPVVTVSPGRFLVHEENIVVRNSGAEYLSNPASRKLPVLGECS